MTLKFMGKKVGMTHLFDEKGNLVVCTVISAEPNVVSQVKTQEKDGYQAIQLAACKVQAPKVKNVTKQLRGHFAKANVEPRRHLVESRLSDVSKYEVGQEITAGCFAENSFVDVTSISKGKGYQGVMKRHNYAGGPASHGSGFHRHAGSTGMRSSPGRNLPGGKKAGHMGAEQVTVQNLQVVKVDEEKNVILLKGAVPGFNNCLVYIAKAKKVSDLKRAKN